MLYTRYVITEYTYVLGLHCSPGAFGFPVKPSLHLEERKEKHSHNKNKNLADGFFVDGISKQSFHTVLDLTTQE